MVVHREVHVDQQEVVDPVADWKASDRSKCDIEHGARRIARYE